MGIIFLECLHYEFNKRDQVGFQTNLKAILIERTKYS